MRSSNRFAVAASALLVYTVAVVLWGAYVRATLSGDGCGDHWPLCNGVAVPTDPSIKTIVELTHRVTSGLCWLWTLVMWVDHAEQNRQPLDRARSLDVRPPDQHVSLVGGPHLDGL